VVESEMVSALYLVFLAQQGVKIEPPLFVEEHQLTAIALSLVMQQFCEKKLLYTQAYLLPSLLDRKGDRFSYQSLQTSQLFSLLERYGQSPIRLSLLMHYTIDMEMMVLYDLFLRQLRNGIRYCFLSHPTPLTLEKAWIQFDKKADTVDIWIMSEFYALRQEYELTPSFTLVQQFIQKKLL
jgi:isoleucyl-tRNA synthetase